MHFIDRSRIPAPSCLEALHSERRTWKEVTHEQRQEIREALKRLDGGRCAYCEGYVTIHGSDVDHLLSHIEHFRSRSRAPQLMFEWRNLFLSCNREESCGRHKDNSPETQQRKYVAEKLIKPDDEDPERFFRFYVDGTIRVRPGLGDLDKRRAEETLRVFNLRDGGLRKMRELAVKAYWSQQFQIIEFLESCSALERHEFLQDELRATANDAFVTTVKHFLLSLLRDDEIANPQR